MQSVWLHLYPKHFEPSPVAKRIEAIKLYLEGVGFRGLERLTGVPQSTLINWIKNLSVEIERLRPELTEQVMAVELDEMWHFIPKKHKGIAP